MNAALSQEHKVSDAFSAQAVSFDEYDRANPILQWMRNRVQEHVLRFAKTGGRILELNCGTGIDALFFAGKGFEVYATDNSDGMLETFRKKLSASPAPGRISASKLSFHELEKLNEQKFDHIFSNFGGLNCSGDLAAILRKMPALLHEKGKVSLVIMPRVCPWEMALALKGNFKLAGRRFSRKGAVSRLENTWFTTWYYSPRYVKKTLNNSMRVLSLEGLASLSPPPYLENFGKRFPAFLRGLQRLDERLCHLPPFRSWADHYIITLEKR